MSSWGINDLQVWDEKIKKVANENNLDWYPISYEICDYYEMIGHMSYHGMPSHYNHWSFGKSFERTHQMYNLGQSGLPYELIINANPSIAYLMRQNDLYLQILIMAHCVGHSDFFKNNRCFKHTDAKNAVTRFRNARNRIQSYSENPLIGEDAVEKFLDNLHTIRYQTERYNLKRLSQQEIKNRMISKINSEKHKDKERRKLNLDRLKGRLLESDHDLLAFLMDFGDHFEDWQLDIINIVREESHYFIPQVRTKILNEGWASFWHYKILHELDLPQEYHIPFLKMHNAVVRPHLGGVNPYHVGFYLFQKIEREMGLEECFLVRETHDDVAAIRMYLDEEDFRKLNLFTFSKDSEGSTFIDEVSDHDDWATVKNELIKNTGINSIPTIHIVNLLSDRKMVLRHDHDGRDLELDYADNVVNSIRQLWPYEVALFTMIEGEVWEI